MPGLVVVFHNTLSNSTARSGTATGPDDGAAQIGFINGVLIPVAAEFSRNADPAHVGVAAVDLLDDRRYSLPDAGTTGASELVLSLVKGTRWMAPLAARIRKPMPLNSRAMPTTIPKTEMPVAAKAR